MKFGVSHKTSQDNDVLCTVAVDKLTREWLLEVACAVTCAVLLCSVVCPVCVWDLRWLLFLFFSSFRPMLPCDGLRLAVQMVLMDWFSE